MKVRIWYLLSVLLLVLVACGEENDAEGEGIQEGSEGAASIEFVKEKDFCFQITNDTVNEIRTIYLEVGNEGERVRGIQTLQMEAFDYNVTEVGVFQGRKSADTIWVDIDLYDEYQGGKLITTEQEEWHVDMQYTTLTRAIIMTYKKANCDTTYVPNYMSYLE